MTNVPHFVIRGSTAHSPACRSQISSATSSSSNKQWSSQRTPVEVFQLLEGIFGEFDAIATRYNVFKVETIGDCYVAATGIPNAQPDHAVIMARFAQRCMLRLSDVTCQLVDSLGEDTATLEMRIGLHSGATTGGVLRGQKARFQLFGDTVNTAARMESNGVRGRIHVSQSTADALIAKGKGHWLSQRVDKVIAKGKGEMQTYWVNVTSDNAAPSRASAKTISISIDDKFASRAEQVDEESGVAQDQTTEQAERSYVNI